MNVAITWTIVVVVTFILLVVLGVIVACCKSESINPLINSRSRHSDPVVRSESSRRIVQNDRTAALQETNHPHIVRQSTYPSSQTFVPPTSPSPPASGFVYNTHLERNQGGNNNVGTLPTVNYQTRRSSYKKNNRHRHSFPAPYPTSISHPLPRLAPYPVQPSHPLPQTSICLPSVVAPYPTQPLHPLPHTHYRVPSKTAPYPVHRHSFEFPPTAPAHNLNDSFSDHFPLSNFSNSASCSNRPPSYAEAMAAEQANGNRRARLQKSTSLYDNS